MFRLNLLPCLFVTITLLSGCTIKTTLTPIDDGLKPKASLAGKVHLMPLVDGAHLRKQPDGYYTLISNAPETRYVSTNDPASVLDESIAKCLTQAGMTVTKGSDVPPATDLVLSSNFYRLYLDRYDPLWAASVLVSALTLNYTSSGNPRAYLGIANQLSDPRNSSKSLTAFLDMDYSIHHLTESSGGVRAFRLVQEKYCGWLQQKVADFMQDPVQADKINKAEMEAVLKKMRN